MRIADAPDARWPYVAVCLGLIALSWLAVRMGWRPSAERGGVLSRIEQPLEPAAASGAAVPTMTLAVYRPAGAPLVQPKSERAGGDAASRLRDPIASTESSEGEFAPTVPAITQRVTVPQRKSSATPVLESGPGVTPRIYLPCDALLRSLKRFDSDPTLGPWAGQVIDVLHELQAIPIEQTEAFERHVQRLAALAELGAALAGKVSDAAVQADLMRLQYALSKRVDLWTGASQFAKAAEARSVEIANASAITKSSPQDVTPSRGAIDIARLLADVEEYELSRMPDDGRRLTEGRRQLSQAGTAGKQWAEQLETHYRNANVRVAVTGELLNRMLPKTPTTEAGVADTVQGLPVRGRRWTDTRLFVRLIPDERRVRLGLEAHGDMLSETAATAGPATFYNTGQSQFLARKLVIFDGHRVRQWPAVADADSQTELRNVRTDFDIVPLIGPLVRSIARSKYDAQQGSAKAEVRDKISDQARSELDDQAAPQLDKLHQRLTEQVVRPLSRYGLSPTPISQSTDARRFVVRYRLAGNEQLGGHTARPQAPGNSLFSIQVHESAVNNFLTNLKLAGVSADVRELYAMIGTQLGQENTSVPDEIPEGVQVTFADRDPVVVRFVDGSVIVMLRLKELEAERKRWRNLTIEARYAPRTSGMTVNLARADAVKVTGERLAPKSQLALRAIFSNMFSRDRQTALIPEKLTKDPRLADLHVTQCELADGWLGLAIAPAKSQPSAASDQARQPGAAQAK